MTRICLHLEPIFQLIISLVYKPIISLHIKHPTINIISNVIINCVRHKHHFKLNLIKYNNQIIYVNNVISTNNPFLAIKNIRGIIGKGPHDIHIAAIYKPKIVENSTIQNDAKLLAHNFLSPLVKRPYCVLRQTDTPHTYIQYKKHTSNAIGVL